MKKFINILIVSFFAILFNSCAIHEDFVYDGYHHHSVYYVGSYDYHYHKPKHGHIHKPHHHKPKYDAKHHKPNYRNDKKDNFRPNDKRRPSNNRGKQPSKPPRSSDRNGRYKR